MAIERRIGLFNDPEISGLLESVKGKFPKLRKTKIQSVYQRLETRKMLERILRKYSKKVKLQEISNRVEMERKTIVYSFPDGKSIILYDKKEEPIDEGIDALLRGIKKKLAVKKTMPETATRLATTEYGYPGNEGIVKAVLRACNEALDAEYRKKKP
ncbi:MAG: hypothetical protein M1331_01380 [Candidatus Marsarchaeota archaeon]|nr:hypothetical protein [Candidatus Marsarchaeota archaeon]MCL5106034.1 hypothetical protein [Candidatus Marsarchaeota archaeon]